MQIPIIRILSKTELSKALTENTQVVTDADGVKTSRTNMSIDIRMEEKFFAAVVNWYQFQTGMKATLKK